ncbi:uncharacterized protein LOC131874791 [Cryptomeria japonica]|uniref:uncharacterized protein LOC131874791 n=1 Tax=Cryptomeria japonica TaxID=3369 RepID=UPI0027DA884D|nr:uncharacterized protein LOC131874791 [Cryptomeria japonica]
MGVVTGNRTHKEPDRTKYIKPLADGTQKHGLIVESIYYLAECDRQVSNYIKAQKYIWKDANTRELVDEYFSNSRGTSDFYNVVQLFVGKEKIKQLSVGVVLKDIRPRTRLSDAHYIRVKKKLMDYKMAENPFKDFEWNFARILERHQQMLNKLDFKRQELRQQLFKNKRGEELKRKSGSKRWRLWKVISVATAAAVVALSVAGAVCAVLHNECLLCLGIVDQPLER